MWEILKHYVMNSFANFKTHVEQMEKLEELCKEGWEPYAVRTAVSGGGEVYYLKRKVERASG